MEGRVQIRDKVLFYLPCYDETGDSKVTGEGESIKLCADGVGWNWENKGTLDLWGKKDYALLKADCLYISLVLLLFLKIFSLYFVVGVFCLY